MDKTTEQRGGVAGGLIQEVRASGDSLIVRVARPAGDTVAATTVAAFAALLETWRANGKRGGEEASPDTASTSVVVYLPNLGVRRWRYGDD